MKRREFLRYGAAAAGSAATDSLVFRSKAVADEGRKTPENTNRA